ncbi:MAG: hypothetical protein DWQ19_10485 [Crenarchaeota archaeon]|nr:MAG: hypothetical protein DWQ19_10485 [Thermoproteota archaeon]
MIFEKSFIQALKDRYSDIHPLIFHRSAERSTTKIELFDTLDTLPEDYPIVWDDMERRWIATKDLFQVTKFDFRMEKK